MADQTGSIKLEAINGHDYTIESINTMVNNLQDMQHYFFYSQIFFFLMFLFIIFFVYSSMRSTFLKNVYNNVYQHITDDFKETKRSVDSSFGTLQEQLKSTIKGVRDTHQLLEEEKNICFHALQATQNFHKDLNTVRAENIRLHKELMKCENILRKKIQKLKEVNHAR